jgi:hypothetical protein
VIAPVGLPIHYAGAKRNPAQLRFIGAHKRLIIAKLRSMTILGAALSASQYWCTCGAEVDGLAPQIITQFELSMVRGSKPRVDSPYIN